MTEIPTTTAPLPSPSKVYPFIVLRRQDTVEGLTRHVLINVDLISVVRAHTDGKCTVVLSTGDFVVPTETWAEVVWMLTGNPVPVPVSA